MSILEKWENSEWRRIGFGTFLEDEEGVKKVFRRPFRFAFFIMTYRAILWGGIAFLAKFLFPEIYLAWGLLLIFAIFKVFSAFCHWYVNAILMTTEDLVFVTWEDYFNRKSTRLDYWNLDEIEVERVGIKSFVNNYGSLYFQKYGEGLISFHKVASPNKVARTIEAYREEMVDAKNFTEESALKDLLSKMVQSHVRDNGQPDRDLKIGKVENDKLKIEKKEEKKKKELIVKKKFIPDETVIEVEKELDDNGGIDIDLEE